MGTCDGRTRSVRACLYFFLHLDGLKTPIYTQTIVKWVARIEGERTTTQTPTLPIWYFDWCRWVATCYLLRLFTYLIFPSPQTHPPKNLKIWSLIPFSSFFQQILIYWYLSKSPIRSRDSLLLLLPCCYIWLSGPGSQDLYFITSIFGSQDLGFRTQINGH